MVDKLGENFGVLSHCFELVDDFLDIDQFLLQALPVQLISLIPVLPSEIRDYDIQQYLSFLLLFLSSRGS